jgi:polyisoprenoid-binding protein YceI
LGQVSPQVTSMVRVSSSASQHSLRYPRHQQAFWRRRSLRPWGWLVLQARTAVRPAPVHTTRTGLGAKAGHDLTIEVTRWHGHATVDTADPANCSVTIEVAVDTFQVREATGGVKPLTKTDRAEINKTLQEVLHTAQHPTITFQSTWVDGSAASFTLDGELTIMGDTRPVTVQGRRTDGRGRWSGGRRPEPMGNPALLGVVWRTQAQGRGHGRLRRGPHAGRLTALGRGACPALQTLYSQFRAVRRRL